MKIATHNGPFHADDAFGVAAIRRVYLDATVVRSRDPKVLAEADVRVDVGGRYDPATSDYDHHQRGGAGVRDNSVPYAAFGLVWREFGVRACGGDQRVADVVERVLVQSVDAADCGFALSGEPTVEGAESFTVSRVISGLNPGWHEGAEFDGAFARAVELASAILEREIESARGVVLADTVVREAIASATDPRVVVLERFAPWHDAIFAVAPQALYVLYPDTVGEWKIQCVPDAPGSFGQRKALPEAWGGLRAVELAEATGVADAVFCHPGRFIAGAKTRESVLRLAELALAE